MVAKESGCDDNTGGGTTPDPAPSEPEQPVAKKTVCDSIYTETAGALPWDPTVVTFTGTENCREVAESCTVTYEKQTTSTGYKMVAKADCNAARTMSLRSASRMAAPGVQIANVMAATAAGTDAHTMSVRPQSRMASRAAIASGISAMSTVADVPTTASLIAGKQSDKGDTLYTLDCRDTIIKVVEILIDEMTDEKTEVVYDSVISICDVIPFGEMYRLGRCDTVVIISREYRERDTLINVYDEMDDIYIPTPTKLVDTVLVETYDIRCYAVDTIFTYDTAFSSFTAQMVDTISTSDSLRYGGLLSTDTVLEVCPRLTQTYTVYDSTNVRRLLDSASYYFAVADSLDRLVANGMSLAPISVFVPQDSLTQYDPTAPLPDDKPLYHAMSNPYAARSRAEAYLKQAEKYGKSIAAGEHMRTLEHILDTLHIHLFGETTFGCIINDTFTVSRMPIPYCHIADTGVLYGKEVILWTKSGYCDDDSASMKHDAFLSRGETVLNVDFDWLDPFYGFYASDLTPHAYGDPATDLPADRYNTYGHLLSDAFNPYYLPDTVDGDTVYFPIKVTNNDPRDPYGCSVTDTVSVTIYRGHHISGYISYNGLWHPSDKGITRPEVLAIPDEPVTDADAGNTGTGRHGDHMAISNVKLDLYEYGTNKWIDSTRSDEDGLFTFTQLAPTGRYFIDAYSPQKKVRLGASGISANDASWIQQYAIGAMSTPTNPLSMWWYAANVDLSESPILTRGISANDASAVQQVAIGAMTQYVKSLVIPIDDWAYSNDTFDIDGDTLLHVRGVMRGDANRNYEGTEVNSQLAKAGGMRRFDTYGNIEMEDKERIIDYPILSISEGDVMAFQLFMPYEPAQVELLGIRTPIEGAGLAYNIVGDELLFNWIKMSPVDIHTGDTLAILKLHLKHKPVSRIDRYFRLNPTGYEVTRGNVHVDETWKIALPEIALFYYEETNERDSLGFGIDTVGYTPTGAGDDKEIMLRQQGGEMEQSEILSVIPNPMKTWADITYSVYGDCVVSLKLYTLLGEEVMVIVNSERQTGLYRRNITSSGLAAGVYVLRLETIRDNTMETDVVKVVVQK